MTLGHCEHCGTRLIFTTTPKGDERRLDAEPDPDGDMVVYAGLSMRLGPGDRVMGELGSAVFREHDCEAVA